jgi:hypothetical protein
MMSDKWTDEENTQLAEEFEAALLAELERRNAPWLSVDVVNMGNVNIDIHIQYNENGLRFFQYWGIGHLRRKIREEGLETIIALFTQTYVLYVRQTAEWDYRQSLELLESDNIFESRRESLEQKLKNSEALLERLKMVKGGDDAL